MPDIFLETITILFDLCLLPEMQKKKLNYNKNDKKYSSSMVHSLDGYLCLPNPFQVAYYLWDVQLSYYL